MRVGTVFGAALTLAAYTMGVLAQESGPEIVATAAFPESNPFSHVVNGEKNTLTVTVENKSGKNVTLLNVAGALLHPDSNALLKNLTSLKYGVALLDGLKLQIPYTFHSEYKPGDHRLNVWVEHSSDDGVYKVEAFDSVVTVVDPPLSIFDLKLLSTYAIVAGMLGGLLYLAYTTFVPQPKKTRAKKVPTTDAVSSPVGTVTATGAGGYQEEWIPEHHLRKAKGKKAQGAASGDDLSGAETSGAEGGKRRKSRK